MKITASQVGFFFIGVGVNAGCFALYNHNGATGLGAVLAFGFAMMCFIGEDF